MTTKTESMYKYLKIGSHLGKKFVNSDMEAYHMGVRNNTAIVDIKATLLSFYRSLYVIKKVLYSRGNILFLNTSPELSSLVKKVANKIQSNFSIQVVRPVHGYIPASLIARRSGTLRRRYHNRRRADAAHYAQRPAVPATRLGYCNDKWSGGTLTNWKQISQSVAIFAKFYKYTSQYNSTSRYGRAYYADLFSSASPRANGCSALSRLHNYRFKVVQTKQHNVTGGYQVNMTPNPCMKSVVRKANRPAGSTSINQNSRYLKMNKCFRGLIILNKIIKQTQFYRIQAILNNYPCASSVAAHPTIGACITTANDGAVPPLSVPKAFDNGQSIRNTNLQRSCRVCGLATHVSTPKHNLFSNLSHKGTNGVQDCLHHVLILKWRLLGRNTGEISRKFYKQLLCATHLQSSVGRALFCKATPRRVLSDVHICRRVPVTYDVQLCFNSIGDLCHHTEQSSRLGCPNLNPRSRHLHLGHRSRGFNLNGQVHPCNLLIVLNPNDHKVAIREARSLGLPVLSFVDSNTKLMGITYPVIGNAGSLRFIHLYMSWILKLIRYGMHRIPSRCRPD